MGKDNTRNAKDTTSTLQNNFRKQDQDSTKPGNQSSSKDNEEGTQPMTIKPKSARHYLELLAAEIKRRDKGYFDNENWSTAEQTTFLRMRKYYGRHWEKGEETWSAYSSAMRF